MGSGFKKIIGTFLTLAFLFTGGLAGVGCSEDNVAEGGLFTDELLPEGMRAFLEFAVVALLAHEGKVKGGDGDGGGGFFSGLFGGDDAETEGASSKSMEVSASHCVSTEEPGGAGTSEGGDGDGDGKDCAEIIEDIKNTFEEISNYIEGLAANPLCFNAFDGFFGEETFTVDGCIEREQGDGQATYTLDLKFTVGDGGGDGGEEGGEEGGDGDGDGQALTITGEIIESQGDFIDGTVYINGDPIGPFQCDFDGESAESLFTDGILFDAICALKDGGGDGDGDGDSGGTG